MTMTKRPASDETGLVPAGWSLPDEVAIRIDALAVSSWGHSLRMERS